MNNNKQYGYKQHFHKKAEKILLIFFSITNIII